MQSALHIAVPAAEQLVKPFRDRLDPSAAVGVPAHITLLFPFVPPSDVDDALCDELAELFARFAPFRFALGEMRRFPTTLYLAPDPDEPFRSLISAIVERYPAYPPYGGAYASPVPHLTLAQGESFDDTERQFLHASHGALPIEAEADAVTLMLEGNDGVWRDHRSFRLGG